MRCCGKYSNLFAALEQKTYVLGHFVVAVRPYRSGDLGNDFYYNTYDDMRKLIFRTIRPDRKINV